MLLAIMASAGCMPDQDCLYLEIRYLDPSGEWIRVPRYTLVLEVGADRLDTIWDARTGGPQGTYEVGGFTFQIISSSIWTESYQSSRGPRVIKITLDSEEWKAEAVIRPDYIEPTSEECRFAIEELHLVPKSP